MKKKFILKDIILALCLGGIMILSSGCEKPMPEKKVDVENKSTKNESMYSRPANISSPEEAKNLLLEGNKRFTTGKISNKDFSVKKIRELSQKGQEPFAVILSCSDSRIPPETVFDQGLGDLFVIRNAGNVVESISLGSIEYGVGELKAPLVVVLGHEKCGAVKATVDGHSVSENIAQVVNKIKPSYEKVKASSNKNEEVYKNSEDENIRNSIDEIKKSDVIKNLLENKQIEVVGAKYNIETGEIKFMD
ncbi:carbonic anhydrase CynT [Gottschalkia purinilytica]|uniref:carbonic anhydrase n=1 Tax=Gottschalkia purinilytica TaxID=1503 RepID=A0A0L0W9R6_GOTPU|nr:carbonic anhydrase [Gottschalkia purinilytica]KNF08298.1 carbonic anhydrase CynT [Gottschalkia purinilytica]